MEDRFNENRGLTLVGLIVNICTIIILLALIFVFLINPGLNHVRGVAERVECGTNMKGLGTAIEVYARDYDGRFPQLPGEGPWSKELGFDYDLKDPDFEGLHKNTGRTITASWYLLVREADVSPKSFVCPSSKEKAFDGRSKRYPDLDFVYMRDFGDNPHQSVSYVMQNPYGKYPAHRQLNAGFAVAADMNPWMKEGEFVTIPNEKNYPQIIKAGDKTTYKYGNTLNHPEYRTQGWTWNRYIKGTATGQNVLFADGHSTYKEQPNCGMNDDNIYTYWPDEKNPTEQDIQGGKAPTGRNEDNDAQSREDSFLVL